MATYLFISIILSIFFLPIWTFVIAIALLVWQKMPYIAIILALLVDILTLPHMILPIYFDFQFSFFTVILTLLYSLASHFIYIR